MHAVIAVKRVYDAPADADGARFLVDRLWPRGLRKDRLPLDGWLRDVAPSEALRRWFGHEPAKWMEFRERYGAELKGAGAALAPLLEAARRGPLTLLTAVKDLDHAHAQVLRDHLRRSLRRSAKKRARK